MLVPGFRVVVTAVVHAEATAAAVVHDVEVALVLKP